MQQTKNLKHNNKIDSEYIQLSCQQGKEHLNENKHKKEKKYQIPFQEVEGNKQKGKRRTEKWYKTNGIENKTS